MSEYYALIPAAVPLVIAVVKLLLPRIPKVWLPILAPVLGALADIFIQGAQGGAIQAPWLGAALGAAGVGLREIADQVRKLNGRV